jgi:peptide/nickel transport system permease protein
MAAYIFKRLLLMLPTFIGIIAITFAMVRLAPGDPALLKAQIGSSQLSSQSAKAIIEETRAMYGFDKPMWRQFASFVKRMATFDFGRSLHDGTPVIEKIGKALPITLLLNIITIIIIYSVSVPIGIYTSMRPRGFADRFFAVILLVFYSLPAFWVATMLIVYLGGGDHLNLFPIIGIASDSASRFPWYTYAANVAWHLVLPVICLTYGGFAYLSRFVRATFLDVVRQDFVRTARAKGLSDFKVMTKHVMRNALIPIVTLASAILPALIGGSVIIEQVFSIPGMGRLGFEAVLMRDYPVIMAIATISAFLTLVSMLIADIMYVIVDPRVSFDGKG